MKLSDVLDDQLKKLSIEQKNAIVYGNMQQCAEKVDVAIVLGTAPPKSRYRAIACAELYEKGLVKSIIVSGAPTNEVDGKVMSEAAYMRAVLIQNGVEESVIYMDEQALTTVENMICSAHVLHRNISFYNTDSVCIVSSACHMRRSLELAKAFFPKRLKIYGYSTSVNGEGKDEWYKSADGIKDVDWEIRCLKKLIRTNIIDDIEF